MLKYKKFKTKTIMMERKEKDRREEMGGGEQWTEVKRWAAGNGKRSMYISLKICKLH